MRSGTAISTRFSNFRFSLGPLRSPVSPLPPQTPQVATNNHRESVPSARKDSGSSSSSGEKEPSTAVHVVDGEGTFPRPALSPITPWHASFHRKAASTDQETSYLRQTAYLRYGRHAVSLMLVAGGVALMALESNILKRYNSTHLGASWHLDLWPTDLNLKPTILLLATGVLSTFLALLTVIVAAIPSPNSRTKLHNGLFTLLTIITTPLALATLIFNSMISPAAIFSSFVSSTVSSLVTTTGPGNTVGLTPNGAGDDPKRETIQSFTCALTNTARAFNHDAQTLSLPSMTDVDELVPTGFPRICAESHAGLAIAVVILGLAALGLVIAGFSWAVERNISRLRKAREVVASRDGSNVPESLVGIPYEKHDQV